MDTFKRKFRQHQIRLVVLVLSAAMSGSALTTWLTTEELPLLERLEDIALAMTIAFLTASALLYYTIRVQGEYLKLHLKVDQIANTDDLTGLANRRSFIREGNKRLAMARTSNTQIGLLLVDIDWFKHVNDTYGHDAGDQTLCHIAHTLRDAAPDTALVSRLGGEEFTVMCEAASPEALGDIAEAMRRQIEAKCFRYKSEIICTTISIGLSMTRDGDTLSTLLSRADKALYDAKSHGRNRFALAA